MGHKVHPTGFRLGVVAGWQSRWYAERDYKDILAEDFKIRQMINKELANAAVSRIEIERTAANQIFIRIRTAKPGIVIGKSGEKVDRLRGVLEGKTKKRVRLEISEIRQPELDAYLVGRSIAEQLEKRVSFRRAMKQAVQKTMRANAKGIKVIVGGRLGGAEIARSEKEVEGKVPLQTLRADIDYGLAEAHTTFGVIGIKVWIYKGDVLPNKRREPGDPPEANTQQAFTPRDDRRGGGRRDGGGDRGGDRGPQRGGDNRGPRPQGDRPRPQGGDNRGPRPQGDNRGPRPQGDNRGPRPQGDRPFGDRPQGDRPQGDRPQGDRPPRPQGDNRGPRPQGDRPQGERPQGDRPPRPQGDRGPRPQGDRPPRPEQQAPVSPATSSQEGSVQPAQQSAPSAPATPQTDAGTTQSE